MGGSAAVVLYRRCRAHHAEVDEDDLSRRGARGVLSETIPEERQNIAALLVEG